MSPQASALPEEILEQIFLRLPPDEPTCLVHASLTSKLWLAHLSGARFRGIYCEFHGSPPMLGFIYRMPLFSIPEQEEPLPLFVPTTKFSARTPNNYGHRKYLALDCRHGRVLLVDSNNDPKILLVWNPMTGCQSELHPPAKDFFSYGVAVLCPVTSCDHHSCHEGHSQVVFFGLTEGIDGGSIAYVYVSSQETGDWDGPCSILDLGIVNAFIKTSPPVLIERAVLGVRQISYDFLMTQNPSH